MFSVKQVQSVVVFLFRWFQLLQLQKVSGASNYQEVFLVLFTL